MKAKNIIEKKVKKIIERESIGIKKLDEMISGGLPLGSVIGLSGPPGVGKSIFSLHFLLEGARKGQKCVYINLEEPMENIENMISQFEFSDEFFKYVNENKIIMKCFGYSEYEKIYLDLFDKIREDKTIKRLVIDTFNCFFSIIDVSDQSSNALRQRKIINESFSMLRENKMTTLLVLESISTSDQSYYNIPHLVDGMINLDFLELGTIERRIFIPKMRWTDQFKEGKGYEINFKGISILDS